MGIAEDRADIQAQFISTDEAVQMIADLEGVPKSQAANWLLYKVMPAGQIILTCQDGLKLSVVENEGGHLDAIKAIKKGLTTNHEANPLGFGRKRFYETLENEGVIIPDHIKHAARSFVPDEHSLIAQDIRSLEHTVQTLLEEQRILRAENEELKSRVQRLERQKDRQASEQESGRISTDRAINRLNYVLFHMIKGDSDLSLETPYAVFAVIERHADLHALQCPGKELVAQRIKAAVAQHKKDLKAEQDAANVESVPDNPE